jgi:hypothetical protein
MGLGELAEHTERLSAALADSVATGHSAETERLQTEVKSAREELEKREEAKRAYRQETGLMPISAEELKERFARLAIQKEESEDFDESDRIYWLLDNIVSELEARGGEQWRTLIPLYEHSDIRVRHHAASFTQRLLPNLARERLWAIDENDWRLPGNIDESERQAPRLPDKVRTMSDEQLVRRFIDLELKQTNALLGDAIDEYNRRFSLVDAVTEELKSRSGDRRTLLLPYLQHSDIGVRLKVAKNMLAIAPEAARLVLEAIANSGEMPFAGDAGMSIWNLDRGVFKPT